MSSADESKYAITLKEMAPDSKLGRLLELDAPRVIPFYVRPGCVEVVKQGEPGAEEATDAVRGILLMAAATDPEEQGPWVRHCMERFTEEIQKTAPLPSAEKLVLDVAATLCTQHGVGPGRQALLSGSYAFPESSKIKSDLIFDDWVCLSLFADDQVDSALCEIIILFAGIDFDQVYPAVLEPLCFINYIALSLLGRQEEREVFEREYVARYVRSRRFEPVLRYLRENTEHDREYLFSQELVGNPQDVGE